MILEPSAVLILWVGFIRDHHSTKKVLRTVPFHEATNERLISVAHEGSRRSCIRQEIQSPAAADALRNPAGCEHDLVSTSLLKFLICWPSFHTETEQW